MHHPRDRVGDPADLLLHQNLLQRSESRTADRLRHVGGVQAQFDRAGVVLGGQLLGQLTAGHLGFDLVGDQGFDELAGGVPDP